MSTTGDVIFLVFAFLAVVAVSEVLARKGDAWGLVARRDLAVGKRIPTAGGIGFLPGLISVMVLLSLQANDLVWLALTVGATLLVAVVGLVDDTIDLAPAIKLAAEIAICVPVVWWWVGDLGIGLVGLYVLLIVGTINLVNFSDNMDGLAAALTGTTALGVTACPAYASDTKIAWVIVVICAGFLVHNRPPARLHMGDTGSMSLGFVLGTVLVGLLTTYGRPEPTAASVAGVGLLLGVMLLDGAQVVAARAMINRPIMPGDRRHLSHRWLKLVPEKGRVLRKLWAVHLVFVGGGVAVFEWPQLWPWFVVPLGAGGVLLVRWLWKVPGDEYPKAPPADLAEE